MWTNYINKRPKQQTMDMRCGPWNVRSLYRAVSLMRVTKETSQYKLDLVGVQEVKWDRGGSNKASGMIIRKHTTR
jgi:hypothetical protein